MNIAIAQSGGPTCAINASLIGIFKQGLLTEQIDAIFGSINGIEGMIGDELINLKSIIRTNEDMELLRQTPSTMLGSCRYKLPDSKEAPEIYEKILHTLEIHQIEIFLYIGGNDSMDTIKKLSDYAIISGSSIRFVGCPKTI
ncbi:MAG: 6-phosphofructokinase, partial [Oscillospiraceae bacterium]|nr:6-phosphofructokinase [Oscillospiraceae bacterium]